MLSMIVAMSEKDRVIGLDGDLPWKLRADLLRFKQLTTGNTVVMGRKTWESIPEKFRPLPNRKNAVLTRQEDYLDKVPDGVLVASSLQSVFDMHRNIARMPVAAEWGELFIIGGSSLYEAGLAIADKIYLTTVEYDGPGDTFFPEDPFKQFQVMDPQPEGFEHETPADEKNSHASRFCVLERREEPGA